ncbi:MAG TPA: NADH-quinone oxidoreductase subunit NuoF [Candidatus Omnitrophota bacterium]|nr:NADH-quinone oxidoreductase subunit NuoF [Candidatus Omnitrophota bacterium]
MVKLSMAQLDSFKRKKEDGVVVRVGMSSCGVAAGSKDTFQKIQSELKANGIDAELMKCGCLGMCYAEPLVEIERHGVLEGTYGNVDAKAAAEIIQHHLVKGNPQAAEISKYRIVTSEKQIRIVLRNCGVIDPENIEDYLAQDGYQGLKKVLTKGAPDKVLEELKLSGLRGRGGGGFPTWMKWSFARGVQADQKFIICNGDEGDPGAYMDRSVLEGDPHSVLEGMIIAGFTVGASRGFFYIRAEYPLAIERIQKAIDQAHEYGLLGEHILGTKFSFDLEVRLGAGAFVCGEETALIASIEGKRGCPTPRPPYPSVKGLWGKPTVINNVETLANVPVILNKGGEWFSQIGTKDSKGTKVFALTGKVKNTGLVEVPMGITLREIVFDIGGGTANGKKIKAIQTGGPSGGVIPEQFFDTPVDYENLQKLGSIMGSGGMIVMDEDDCMIDIAKFYLGFCVDESCGKCAPCRIGGTQLLGYLKDISEGKASEDDLAKMRRISVAMQKASLCGLGQTASNPVLSTLQYFEEEYRTHIKDKRCPAGKCSQLFNYSIIQEKCRRCTLCQRNCPVGAIPGDREQGFWIVPEKCIRCGQCFEVCKFGAIKR